MAGFWFVKILSIAVVLGIVVGCGAPSRDPGGSDVASSQGARQAPAKRTVTIVETREPTAMEPSLQPQNREWSALGSGFLAYFKPGSSGPLPFLAEELPSVEKGTWTVLPDGRMETTYKIKRNATWHDGAPITAHDWVFGYAARTAPELPVHNVNVEKRLTQVVAVDDHTLFLEWREPYLWAGLTHLPDFSPMPRHKLEAMFLQERAAFVDGPHWREEFVGSGPYRVASWNPGVEIVFRGHDGFVLGKPRLDEVRVRFMGDANTMVANLLSGGIDMAYSGNIGFPQGQALEQAGWGGKVNYVEGNPRFLEFQGRDWGDTVTAAFDPRVRRAAHHAIDRKALVDAIYAGRAPAAYFWLSPSDPAYPAVDRAVPKFDYDPSRSEALLREAGWTKAPDGRMRNATGQALSLPMMNLPGEAEQLEAAVVADNWRTAGITSEVHRLSPQEWRDNELRSKFPAVAYNRRNLSYDDMVWFSANLSRPEIRWGGQNRNGYVNLQLDDRWGRVLASVDAREREGYLIDAIRIMMDDAMVVLTHLQAEVMAHHADLVGPTEPAVVRTSRIWNVWEWEWK
jgi:peptide/nickel transport system substrate-binding protein